MLFRSVFIKKFTQVLQRISAWKYNISGAYRYPQRFKLPDDLSRPDVIGIIILRTDKPGGTYPDRESRIYGAFSKAHDRFQRDRLLMECVNRQKQIVDTAVCEIPGNVFDPFLFLGEITVCDQLPSADPQGSPGSVDRTDSVLPRAPRGAPCFSRCLLYDDVGVEKGKHIRL